MPERWPAHRWDGDVHQPKGVGGAGRGSTGGVQRRDLRRTQSAESAGETMARQRKRAKGDDVVPTVPRRQLLLAIAATDRTFELQCVRGEWAWVGHCIHCNTRIAMSPDGRPDGGTTLEHIVPRHHGGGEDLVNVALACGRCNQGKGMRHDHQHRDDPRLRDVIATLQARRTARWRDPSTVAGPAGETAVALLDRARRDTGAIAIDD